MTFIFLSYGYFQLSGVLDHNLSRPRGGIGQYVLLPSKHHGKRQNEQLRQLQNKNMTVHNDSSLEIKAILPTDRTE